MNTSRSLTKTMTRVRAVTVAAVLLGSAAIARAEAVTDWNAIAVATTAGNPFNQARLLAITQLAVFEAVNAVTGSMSRISAPSWRRPARRRAPRPSRPRTGS